MSAFAAQERVYRMLTGLLLACLHWLLWQLYVEVHTMLPLAAQNN